jgi:hypothetical protein
LTVLGTHIPVSPWTLLALLVGTVLSSALAGRVAGRLRWSPSPTLVALLLLTVTLALTVTPDGPRASISLAACIPVGWGDIPVDIAADGGGPVGVAFNVLLYLLPAAALVLAAGRLGPALPLLALPPLVELLQTVLPGRSCAVSDVLSNLLGVLLGAAAGLVAVRRRRL